MTSLPDLLKGRTTQAIDNTPEFKELTSRCDASKIDWTEKTGEGGYRCLKIEIPAGRDKRSIRIYTLSHIRDFLNVPFERLTFLGDYLAVCCYEEGTIEAEIEILSAGASSTFDSDFEDLVWFSLSKKSSQPSSRDSSAERGEFFSCCLDDVQISIGPIAELKAFRDSWVLQWPTGIRPSLMDHDQRGVTLKVKGLHIKQHDEAVDVLERIANSVFFQIDVALNVPLALKKQARSGWKDFPSPFDNNDDKVFELQFPRYEYDEIPIQLYWYGKKASGMPLLQFLAYYQVIEFYFPTYSRAEALSKVRAILKNPYFRPDSDAALGKILAVLQTYGGRGFGKEREQLFFTLQACVDEDTLRDFLSTTVERADYFSGKIKGLKSAPIPINDPKADLRNAIANRIYQIRCRIVHAKGESGDVENEPILPFSDEAELLYQDIALVQQIARQVLIRASRSLHF